MRYKFTSVTIMPQTGQEETKSRQEGVSKHKIIKEKDSLYVFILAYNESLFFE